jgi:hypothetical protein
MGLDTKTYWLTDWLTDRQSQCDFDFDFDLYRKEVVWTITSSVLLENRFSGRVSQGACRQDELIGGKPPVGK